MTEEEKLALLEDLIDFPAGSLDPETALDSIDEWDSITVIGYLVILDEKFGKNLTGDAVRNFKTVKDAIDEMR